MRFIRSFFLAVRETVQHDGIEHSGYMAFLSLLSLFPFLVFLMALLGFIGQSEIGTQFVEILFHSLPEHVVMALRPRINEIISGPPQGLLTLAIIGTIWTSSSAVEGLRTILNRIYRVNTPPPYIFRRCLSIVQFLLLTAVLILVMAALIITPVLATKLLHLVDWPLMISPIWNYIRYGAIMLILFAGVCWLYYVIPNMSIRLRTVFPGAALVVVGWILVGSLLSKYLSHFRQVDLIYGSLEGIIVTLLFFYIMHVIFIFGAEFNYLLHRQPSSLSR